MRLNRKRVALVIAFIAIVFLIGYILYWVFLRPNSPTQPTTSTTQPTTNTGLPTANTGGTIQTQSTTGGSLIPSGTTSANNGTTATSSPIANGGLVAVKNITSDRTLMATLANNGRDIIYYDQTSGLFYRVAPTGTKTPLSDTRFYQVQNITWAPNKQKAVLEYPDGANIVYDFNTNQQVSLPKHWKDFSFSPNSDQITFKSIGTDPNNRWLATSNADGSRTQQIAELGDQDATVYVDWSPNSQMIAMQTEGAGNDVQNLYFVGLHNENFKLTTVAGRGFTPLWSTNGDRLLYSVYNTDTGSRPNLWLVDAQTDTIGQNRRNLNIETWADKCTFKDNTTIYCAVPRNLPEQAGIFREDLDQGPNDIYKIDTRSGFKSLVAIPNTNQTISSVMVDSTGQYLYYTDQTTGQISQIRLQ